MVSDRDMCHGRELLAAMALIAFLRGRRFTEAFTFVEVHFVRSYLCVRVLFELACVCLYVREFLFSPSLFHPYPSQLS